MEGRVPEFFFEGDLMKKNFIKKSKKGSFVPLQTQASHSNSLHHCRGDLKEDKRKMVQVEECLEMT